MDEIVLIERKLPDGTKKPLYFMTGEQAKFMKGFNSLMRDAERELTEAFKIEQGANGYTTVNLEGTGGGEPEPLQEWQMKILKRYWAWRKICPRLTLAIVTDRCSPTTSFSIPEIAYQRDIGNSTVYRHLNNGFRLYLEVNKRT